jgi:purine nucleoside permease
MKTLNRMKTSLFFALAFAYFSIVTAGFAKSQSPVIKMKVFIGAMFEVGANSGDKAGEFQFWYERYFSDSQAIRVKGAANPIYCNQNGVCGSVLGMGKVGSSASVQAIILNEQFDVTNTYFIISGVAGTPPSKGTIGDVSWGSYVIDYDLGHRWHVNEGKPNEMAFTPRKGYESIRRYQLNPELLHWALSLSEDVQLKDSSSAKQYRMRYPNPQARRSPAVNYGTHITGDTFFHGPGLSNEAQYISQLYEADDYVITEMEAAAIAQVLDRTLGTSRMMSLRGAVNFDQGHPKESTLDHLDPAPGQTAGGFAETVENIALVGARITNHIVANWETWQHGVPEPND